MRGICSESTTDIQHQLHSLSLSLHIPDDDYFYSRSVEIVSIKYIFHCVSRVRMLSTTQVFQLQFHISSIYL